MIPDTTTVRVADPGVLRSRGLVWGIATVVGILGVLLLGFVLGKWITDSDSDVVELPRQAATAAVAAAPQAAAASAPAVGLTIGQPAPDFTLQTPDGQTMQLSALKGQPVLLNFWATWCGPCAIEMPALEQIYRKYQDQGLVVLGVNQGETGDRVTQYLRGNNLSFPSVLDAETNVARQYRVTGYPTTWLVDADGTLRQVRRGAFLDVSQVERMVADVIARK